jgi:hypothetical protein
MTLDDTIQQVRSANPIRTDPPLPPIEPLLERLDLAVRSPEDLFTVDSRRPLRRTLIARVAVGAAIAIGAAVGVIAIAGAPNGGGLSVAAAVEQAITPHGGVLHMVIDSENIVDGRATSTSHEELWTAQSPRRLRSHNTLNSGGEVIEGEGAILSTSPPRTLSWSSSQPDTIRESRQPILQEEQTPVDWLRKAYREGRLQVLGREELHGQSVWRLSVLPEASQPPRKLNGAPVPSPTVTVDAHTFVPLENVIYSVGSANGQPALETTKVRYLSYQELPSNSSNLALLRLGGHPGAKVVAEPSATRVR